MLYPETTSGRMAFDLSGIWEFKLLEPGQKEREEQAAGKLLKNSLPMPVPSSYNDIYPGKKFADHMGDMVYQRSFTVTETMQRQGRLVLRFGGVTHMASVYLNGAHLGCHKGGFLPFSFDITESAVMGENLLTVYVNNVTDYSTLPCGRVVTEQFPGLPEQTRNLPNFDFFNYSGIMRPVWLYTTPRYYIEDIEVYGRMDGSFCWNITSAGEGAGETRIRVLDAEGACVFSGSGANGEGRVPGARLWSTDDPYLYRLQVRLPGADGGQGDEYTESFGFREIAIRDCRILLNGKPVYLKGFGKHEEGITRGRGTDIALMVKDLGLLKWIGANSFRTSHYPNSEEMMRLCDRMGILVIDEAPAVGLNTGFTATGLLGGNPKGTWETLETAEHHRTVMQELVKRDKNHPCVIAWSVANEPASQEKGAREYFEPLMEVTRQNDIQKRPVTIVTYEGSTPETCQVAELCDFLMLNRYRGWYDTEGNLEGAAAKLKAELEGFHRRCPDKPVMLGEYGADTIAGLHDVNGRLFSEEYQTAFMRAYGEVFDSLPYITGEHVWVFADFATAENIKRVDGNKKGIFTRDRRPKQAAYFLKERWSRL
ncbi:MAG: beta-glucuronidase [Marvinbryantia sp.]|mgnify:CR=1 FL=1|uniref:beta-glucuronidase n=1 Tax=Marvinbryantia sp. TaxID=2496532 RepID=UPI0025E96017|nr:beta-glucuronidase [uncultured Marvinbryantia sp.]